MTSKEMIRPSSPTPHHLQSFKLSFLDQLLPAIYCPLILFYQAHQLPSETNRDRPKLHQSLQKSLSNILTQFYPLAGRLSRENFTVDCNDSGALFVKSKVHANVLEVIRDPTMEELDKYWALGPNDSKNILLAVQINLFECGGIAIAVQMHHNIGDGCSLLSFINAWAAAARGGDNSVISAPISDLTTLFPRKDVPTSLYEPFIEPTEEMVAKRFVFDRKTMEKIKTAEMESSLVKDPTRVEVITAFLTRKFRNAYRAKGSNKPFIVGHVVNLRPRMDPPIPIQTFGNVCSSAMAVVPAGGGEADLVGLVRNAIRKFDGDYVKELVKGDELLNAIKNLSAVKMMFDGLTFSSLCGFPLYDVDYGWGRPALVIPGTFPFRNFGVLVKTRCGEGIEAWVNMLKEDAAAASIHFPSAAGKHQISDWRYLTGSSGQHEDRISWNKPSPGAASLFHRLIPYLRPSSRCLSLFNRKRFMPFPTSFF